MNSNSIDKTYGIVAYCTLIGWIISIIRVSSSEGEERKFTAFHLRQMLLLMLLGAAVSIAATILYFIPFIGLILINIISLAVFLCWLFLLISAVRGEKKYLPFIGKAGENMLGDMFE
ncbi:Chloroplast import component protein (Tic20) [compost metagenome]